MSGADYPTAWVAIAEEDFAMAQSALRRKRPFTYSACFHAQQCAEKYLKGMLLAQSQPFPKTHDLVALNSLCAQAGILIGVDDKSLNTLSDHAVQTRYQADAPSLADAREALETARDVRRFARKRLGIK